jgi:hypothetical protein
MLTNSSLDIFTVESNTTYLFLNFGYKRLTRTASHPQIMETSVKKLRKLAVQNAYIFQASTSRAVVLLGVRFVADYRRFGKSLVPKCKDQENGRVRLYRNVCNQTTYAA